MRALIIISASLATVMEPSRTCATNSLTRFRPRSRACASAPKRPCSTIWSSRPFSLVCTVAAAADCCAGSGLAIGFVLLGSHLLLQLVQLLSIGHRFEQQLFQLVIALEGAAQVGKPGTQLQEILERLYLLGDIAGLEIFH